MESSGETWRLTASVALAVAGAGAFAAAIGSPAIPDTKIAAAAGRLLAEGRLDVYAVMPEAQMGPLALLCAAWLPRVVYLAVVCAMLPLAVHLATAGASRARLAACAAVLLVLPWSFYASEGHADDALVAVGVALMLWSLRRHRTAWLVAGFVLAVAAKPTALVFLPLVFFAGRRATAAAVVLGGLVWAPFVLADPAGFLSAGAGINTVADLGLPALLGTDPAGSAFPAWVRPAQLLGGGLLCWAGYRRVGAPAVAMVWAFRALLEPVPYASYSTAVILGAVLVLAWGARWWPGVAALVAAAATWVLAHGIIDVLPPLPGDLAGWLRVDYLLIVIVAAALSRGLRFGSVADRGDPDRRVEVAVR